MTVELVWRPHVESVRPERRPKAGVEGPRRANLRFDSAACGRCAQRERSGAKGFGFDASPGAVAQASSVVRTGVTDPRVLTSGMCSEKG